MAKAFQLEKMSAFSAAVFFCHSNRLKILIIILFGCLFERVGPCLAHSL